MKFVNSPTLRLAALCVVCAVATGCPSPSETETTIKPSTKKSSTPKPSGTASATSTATSSPGGSATATPSANPTSTTGGNGTPNPNATPTPKASADGTASGTATPTPTPSGATPTPKPSSTATATPTATPTTGATPTTPVATATPTPTPTATTAPAGTGNVLTFAGRGQEGYIDAGAQDALFNAPSILALQGTTALFVGDTGDMRIRRIDMATKQVTTVAGSGASGFQNGIGRSATFGSIRGLAVDSAGNIYVGDAGGNHLIRKIDMTDPTNPNVTTFAGIQGVSGTTNGIGTSASFTNPWGLAIKGSIMYVADTGSRVIRSIDLNTREVKTVAGTGTAGGSDGPGSVAQFTSPRALAFDKGGNLIVVDAGTHGVRRVSLSDGNFTVTTLAGVGSAGFTNGAGSGSAFSSPTGGAVGADGALYVADTGNHAIRRVDLNDPNYTVTTYAGNGTAGFQDAQGTNAKFSSPGGVVVLGNTVYVPDAGNSRVRVIQ